MSGAHTRANAERWSSRLHVAIASSDLPSHRLWYGFEVPFCDDIGDTGLDHEVKRVKSGGEVGTTILYRVSDTLMGKSASIARDVQTRHPKHHFSGEAPGSTNTDDCTGVQSL